MMKDRERANEKEMSESLMQYPSHLGPRRGIVCAQKRT